MLVHPPPLVLSISHHAQTYGHMQRPHLAASVARRSARCDPPHRRAQVPRSFTPNHRSPISSTIYIRQGAYTIKFVSTCAHDFYTPTRTPAIYMIFFSFTSVQPFATLSGSVPPVRLLPRTVGYQPWVLSTGDPPQRSIEDSRNSPRQAGARC